MPHVPDSHADHDPLAIAAFAAGDAAGPELDDALALVAACADCAALHHDLRAIATAVTALPAPVRTRDFRLAPEQAAALRPSGWRRFLAPLAGPRFAFAGPLGTGLATLGIAGLLVAGSLGAPVASVAPAADGGAAMAAPAASDAAGAAGGAELYAASAAPVLKAQDPVSPGVELEAVPPIEDREAASGAPAVLGPGEFGISQAGPAGTAPAGESLPAPGFDPGGGALVPLLSALALLTGLVLAGLRLAGRRAAGGS
jgi:hypothetical protein